MTSVLTVLWILSAIVGFCALGTFCVAYLMELKYGRFPRILLRVCIGCAILFVILFAAWGYGRNFLPDPFLT